MSSYTLCYYNGNSGVESTYDTLDETRREGDYIWSTLSASDKARYMDRETGAYFYISENDDNNVMIGVAYDYTDKL